MKELTKLLVALLAVLFLADDILAQNANYSGSSSYSKSKKLDSAKGSQKSRKARKRKRTRKAKPPQAPAEEKQAIDITADKVEQDGPKNLVKARGNVVVKSEDKTIKADRIILNTKSGDGEAFGNVVIIDKGTKMKADRTTFNIKNSQGKLFRAQGLVGDMYRVKGQKFTRITDKHYKAYKTTFTTCKGKLPDWLVEAESVDLKMGDRALFKRGVVKIRDVPIMYIPQGYVPLDNRRKSGFLMPSFGNSNTDGFTFKGAYFWAINRSSDATFYLDYLGRRGVRPGIEYRYTPSKTTQGKFSASFLQDRVSDDLFYKVDWTHDQIIADNWQVSGKLDLVGDNNFDKTFNDATSLRTRRSTDSFLSVNRVWNNHTLDFISRFRDSTERGRDDTFAQLPQVTFKTQKHSLGKTNFYFNQDAQYTLFYTDLDSTIGVDNFVDIHRFDFHPQLSYTGRPTQWLSVTPTIGFRETFYSRGFDLSDNEFDAFSRELFDFETILEGPKFKKIFGLKSKKYPKLKHIIEPRVTYSWIPDIDQGDREKIKVFDAVDLADDEHTVTYSLVHRLFLKELLGDGESTNRDILRFQISQTYDIREATRDDLSPNDAREPFSDIRFDLDSRLSDSLMINMDSTFDVNEAQIRTFNVQLGIKPTDWMSLFLERRFTRDVSTFLLGTVDLNLKKGWRITHSTRFDEDLGEFRENDLSVSFNDSCRCWGFSFDFIRRNLINEAEDEIENKFLFRIHLKGLGTFGQKNYEKLIHRYF